MTKKIMALLLSVIMVVGLMPAMSISAESAASVDTSLYYVDFENYTAGTVYSDGGSMKIDDSNYLDLGTAVNGEIVEMTGYNGDTVKAVKISTDAIALSTSAGSARVKFPGFTAPESGILVSEYYIYVPGSITVDGVEYNQDIKRIIGTPFIKRDASYAVGKGLRSDQYSNIAAINKGYWEKLTYVQNIDTTEVIVYINDELIDYKATSANVGAVSLLQINSRYNTDMVILSDGTEGDDFAHPDLLANEHIIFDKFNFYTPGSTTASSLYEDAEDISIQVSPTVSFSNRILETAETSDGVISADKNIEFINLKDNSAVEIESIEVSADGKGLVIGPAYDLEIGAEYQVTVKNVEDMYGQKIADYTFNFTTADDGYISLAAVPEFTKEELFTPGGSSQAIESLCNGYIRAKISVSNAHGTASKNAILMLVLKEDGAIKSIQFKNATIAPNGTATFNAGFNIDDAANQKIETYVWDSVYGLTPYAAKYTVSAEGISSTGVGIQ